MTKQQFLNKIIPIIENENQKRGNPLFNSVVIAQACLETGYGTSTLMIKARAIFGIKATKNWKGKVYNAKTKECYNGITFTEISACFRAYDTYQESISDYFDLICTNKRYRKACVSENPRECITAIKEGRYATDPNYIKNIMSIISINNLEKYDKKENVINKKYTVGKTYKTLVNLYIRDGAGTEYKKKNFNEITKNAQKYFDKKNSYLKKGTKVTCLQLITKSNSTWIRIPSGFICATQNRKEYIK